MTQSLHRDMEVATALALQGYTLATPMRRKNASQHIIRQSLGVIKDREADRWPKLRGPRKAVSRYVATFKQHPRLQAKNSGGQVLSFS